MRKDKERKGARGKLSEGREEWRGWREAGGKRKTNGRKRKEEG